MQQPSSQLPILDGKYQLIRQLGEGGMGAVYEARHRGTGRRVAVKVIVGEALQKSADIVRRFQNEAMASGSIDSQHIAQVLDTGVDGTTGSPYMVMELLSGEDVSQAIHRVGPVHPEIALRMTAQACLGLQKAHEAGVIHRDIKPANLFLAKRDGGELIVKLLDFGIAKVRADQLGSSENASMTRTGSMLGSPIYMSPEQARGKKSIDHRTDLWSLGVVLFEALTGTTPHGHVDTLGELIVQISTEPPRNIQELAPWVLPEVAAIVHGALVLDPDKRFQSAQAMFDTIRPLLPNGIGLTEALISPIPQTIRTHVAPRFLIESAMRAPAPNSLRRSGADTTDGFAAQGSTTGGLAQSRATAPGAKRSGAAFAAIIAVLSCAVAGGAAWRFLTPHRAPDPAVANPVAVTTPVTPDPAVTAAALAPAPPSTARTVHLAVAPDKARVEVDGRDATIDHGTVEVTGSLGSSHHVRLSLGSHELASDVAIAEDGPIPARMELPLSDGHGSHGHGAPQGAAAPPAPATGNNGAAAYQPPAAAPPAVPAAKPAPPPSPTAPSVSRDFN